jgi:hypothetical protein
MKVKIITMTEASNLEEMINKFLATENIEVLNIQFEHMTDRFDSLYVAYITYIES